jgi:hypothetical protein
VLIVERSTFAVAFSNYVHIQKRRSNQWGKEEAKKKILTIMLASTKKDHNPRSDKQISNVCRGQV